MGLMLKGVHHIAIICSDYQRSKQFYHGVLGLEILHEEFRAERNSYKLDLAVDKHTQIELFSFPDAPMRPSFPEAQGLRHLAFKVENLDLALRHLKENEVRTEEIRLDHITGKRFAFFFDPDNLPLELYEQ